MADEVVDTQAPPESSGQVQEPTQEAEVTEQAGVTAPAEPEQVNAPPQLTPEQIEERAFQRTASWTGRELKKFSDDILGNIRQEIAQFRQAQQPAPALPDKIDAAALLENPDQVLQQRGYVRAADIPRIINETYANQTAAEKRYTTDVSVSAGAIMQADPMFDGEEGKKLATEAMEEVAKIYGTIDRRLPPEVAADLLVNKAVANVARKRAQVRLNPLAGNRPLGPGNGTLKAPPPAQSKAAPIKLDPAAAKIAAMFGNSDKDASELLSKR